MAVFYEIEFTTHHGLYISFIGLVNKFEGTKHISMVSQGKAFLTILDSLVHPQSNIGGAVK